MKSIKFLLYSLLFISFVYSNYGFSGNSLKSSRSGSADREKKGVSARQWVHGKLGAAGKLGATPSEKIAFLKGSLEGSGFSLDQMITAVYQLN